MADRILISKAQLADNNGLRIVDVLIEDGRIAQIADTLPAPDDARIINAEGLLLSYGFCDLHVHFREPGQEAKETIRTGSMAAAHGGYTTVCTMPNLSPAPDAPDTLAIELQRIHDTAVVRCCPMPR